MNTKKYLIEIEKTDKGFRVKWTNDGFSALELLGLLEAAKSDVLSAIKGKSENKIDVVKRQIVK